MNVGLLTSTGIEQYPQNSNLTTLINYCETKGLLTEVQLKPLRELTDMTSARFQTLKRPSAQPNSATTTSLHPNIYEAPAPLPSTIAREALKTALQKGEKYVTYKDGGQTHILFTIKEPPGTLGKDGDLPKFARKNEKGEIITQLRVVSIPLPPGGDAKAAIEQFRAPTENPYETPVQYTYADAAKSLQDQLSQQASKRSKDIKDGISPNPNQNPIYVKYIENGKARILFSVQNQSGKELNPTQKDAIKYGTISRGYTRQTQVSEKASLLSPSHKANPNFCNRLT